MIHHCVGIGAILSAIFSGYSYPGIGCFILLVEVSNVFLDMKLLLLKEELDQPKAILIFICFFLTFFVFRILLMPTALYLGLRMIRLTFDKVSAFRKVFIMISFIQASVLTILIYYWFYRIIRIVLKLLGATS